MPQWCSWDRERARARPLREEEARHLAREAVPRSMQALEVPAKQDELLDVRDP